MGKAALQASCFVFMGSIGCWEKRPLSRGMEAGGDFHHHQPKQGHDNQQRARVRHISSSETQTLKQFLRGAGVWRERA
jgi:hypothetical protein